MAWRRVARTDRAAVGAELDARWSMAGLSFESTLSVPVPGGHQATTGTFRPPRFRAR